jgi:hypothetical protein
MRQLRRKRQLSTHTHKGAPGRIHGAFARLFHGGVENGLLELRESIGQVPIQGHGARRPLRSYPDDRQAVVP